MIEKETGALAASDRGKVAAVFSTGCASAYRCSPDPTVIYGMGAAYGGNILEEADLQTDTPYNSYTRLGLPPTPIALPGRDARCCAPQYVTRRRRCTSFSRGDEHQHVFSETLNAHNAAVNQYIRGPHK